MQYLINQTDLKPFLKNYSFQEIESILVSIYLEKIGKTSTKNKLLQKTISSVNKEQIKEVSSYLKKRKINLTLEYITSFFELLTPIEERNNSGMFITPELIANYLSSETIESVPKTVCDPACGSGALLIAAIKQISNLSKMSIKKIIEEIIYGVDIQKRNIFHSKILLSLLILENGEDPQSVSFNLLCADSLMLDWEKSFPYVFSKNHGFEIILCNPPYALTDLSKLSNSPIHFRCLTKTKLPIFLPFIELMFHISNSKLKSGYIVPLSISYGKTSSFKKIRNIVSNSTGNWNFTFYDRSPDSLFGDNIKIRNCIFVHKKTKFSSKISTSHLIRWNSKIREKLFQKINHQYLKSFDIENSIPKISKKNEFEVLIDLTKKPNLDKKINFKKFDKKQITLDSSALLENSIFYYPTAYNWLSVFRKIPSSNIPVSLNSLKSITCESSQDADFIYACLNSKFAYWWWLVFGDGFHLDHELLCSMPFNPKNFEKKMRQSVVNNAKILYRESVKHPIFSINAGTKTMNYNMLQCSSIIHKIDEKIAGGLGINLDFVDFLNLRIYSHIEAGRKYFKNKELLDSGGMKNHVNS